MKGQMRDLGTLGGNDSEAAGIDDAGHLGIDPIPAAY
jgi:hypothetical protein